MATIRNGWVVVGRNEQGVLLGYTGSYCWSSDSKDARVYSTQEVARRASGTDYGYFGPLIVMTVEQFNQKKVEEAIVGEAECQSGT